MCVLTLTLMEAQVKVSISFFDHFPTFLLLPLSFERELSPNLNLTVSIRLSSTICIRLAGQWGPVISLCEPLPMLRVQICAAMPSFSRVLKIYSQVLMLAQRSFYPLSCSPFPEFIFVQCLQGPHSSEMGFISKACLPWQLSSLKHSPMLPTLSVATLIEWKCCPKSSVCCNSWTTCRYPWMLRPLIQEEQEELPSDSHMKAMKNNKFVCDKCLDRLTQYMAHGI